MPEQNPMSQEEKIRIILAEYTILQTEIIHRKNNGLQIFAVALPIAVGLLYDAPNQRIILVLASVVLFAVVFACAGLLIIRDIRKARRRIKQIEDYINGVAGETLLVNHANLVADNRGSAG